MPESRNFEPEGFAFFDTAIGCCAVAWTGRGIVGVQLPEGSEEVTRSRITARFPELTEVPANGPARCAIEAITALVEGKDGNLAAVRLDFHGVPEFHRRVYEVLRTTARGTTVTYGELAQLAGSPGGARAVGSALRRNPLAVLVPCHRVVAAGGKPGGFSAGGGLSTKIRMLAIEGVRLERPGGQQVPVAGGGDELRRGKSVRQP